MYDKKAMLSTGKTNWATPKDLYNNLNSEFLFDLDPCATEENTKCPYFFTEETDGLQQDWSGHTVFCNPPYGREKTGEWVKKGYQESKKPNTTVVMLVPSRTDTKWFHDYVLGKSEIRFVKGRLKFGGSKENAPFPSMIIIYRSSIKPSFSSFPGDRN